MNQSSSPNIAMALQVLLRWLAGHRWVVVAGGIGLLLIMIFSFSLGSSSSNPFLPYYKAYEPKIAHNSAAPWEQEALQHYSQKEYDLAIPLLEQICADDEVHLDYRLLLGSAYLEVGMSKLAQAQFERVSDTHAIRFRREGLWYLAIAQVKGGDHANAHITLNKLLVDPGHYRKDATKLKSLLDI